MLKSNENSGNAKDIYLRLPPSTLLTVPATLVFFYLVYLLLPFLMLLFLGMLLAVTFEPFTEWLSAKIGRASAVALIGTGTFAIFVALGFLLAPALVEQVSALYEQWPEFAQKISADFPFIGGYLKHLPQKAQAVDASSISPILSHLAKFGGLALGGLSSLVLVFAFMIYLMLDGPRVYEWIIAFFGPEKRSRVAETGTKMAPVISAYVVGQVVTSTLCTIFSFAVLKWLGVPAALLLAVMAGIFDVLPIIGFFLFAVPAALFALSVSPNAMLAVILLFGGYHLAETYLISPLVYGNRLRVSGIVVLSSLIAGGTIGGIVGAIAILPIVASYPIIEEIWLADYLGKRVISKHKKITDSPDSP